METHGNRQNTLETTVSYRAWARLTPTLTHVVTYELVTSGAEDDAMSGGTMDPQRIGALQSLDPWQSLKTFISEYKAPTVRTGILASNKHYPQQGLVQASPPCKLERRPTLRAASPGPRAKCRDQATTADRPIGVP